MDRDTLFRGKRLDNGKWVEGCYGKTITGQAYIFRHETITIGGCFEVEVDPSTVGQYTGKGDCKQHRAFVGDIVRYRNEQHTVYGIIRFGEITDTEGRSKHIGYYIEWQNDGANMWGDWWRRDLGYWLDDPHCEICGNIHDNPELNDEEGGYPMKFRDPAERLTNNVFWFLWAYFIICFLWQGLEMMFYGEIQTRKVDDVMALIWSAFVVLAYYRGRRHGEEDAE